MTTALHTTIERSLPVGYQSLETQRALGRALRVGWGALVPMQTAHAIHGAVEGACKNASLNLFTLDRDLAAFANSGFCELTIDQPTSSPTNCSIEVDGWRKWACLLHPLLSKADSVPSSTPAARALERIKQASGLTTEALAPLVGVSRRTLHLWLAGGQISQRNEERLRALAEALEAIAAVAPETVRQRLMERTPGYPRIYDLLAEGRFEAAIARGTGEEPMPRPVIYPKPHALSTPLAARVAASNDRSIPLGGPIDRRITKRLKW